MQNPASVQEAHDPALWRAAAPHQLGHRERLRGRAKAGGLAALPDYELLELFLFRTFPRGDVKPAAKALLARFGSLAGVGAASIPELRWGRSYVLSEAATWKCHWLDRWRP